LSDSGLRRLVRVVAEEVGQATDYPLERLVEEYLEAQSVEVSRGHSKETRQRLSKLIGWIEAHVNADGRQLVYCGDLDPVDVNAYIRHELRQGRANATVRKAVSALKTAHRWGREASKIEVDPLRGVKLPKTGRKYQGRPRARLTLEQTARLVAAARELDAERMELRGAHRWHVPQAPLLWFYVRTGTRKAELVYARWSDVTLAPLEDAALNLRAETTKTGRGRRLSLLEPDVEVLEYMRATVEERLSKRIQPGDALFLSPRGKPIHRDNLRRWFELVRERAGIAKQNPGGEAVCLHSLRHVVGDTLLQVNPRAAQLMLGHQRLSTTEANYGHDPGAQFLRDAVSKLPGLPRFQDLANVVGHGSGGRRSPKKEAMTQLLRAKSGVAEGNRTLDLRNHNPAL
jgi:site-specific recombinase XerD